MKLLGEYLQVEGYLQTRMFEKVSKAKHLINVDAINSVSSDDNGIILMLSTSVVEIGEDDNIGTHCSSLYVPAPVTFESFLKLVKWHPKFGGDIHHR